MSKFNMSLINKQNIGNKEWVMVDSAVIHFTKNYYKYLVSKSIRWRR